jgi:putative nucleotidyltransferase with HDIG domain
MQEILNALSYLSQYGKKLATVDNSAKLYELIFDFFEQAFLCSQAAVYLKDPTATALTFAAGRGIARSSASIDTMDRIGEDLKGRTVLTGEVQFAVDASASRADSETLSEAAVPLCLGSDVIGVVEATSRTRQFRESDAAVLSVFSEMIKETVSAIRLKETLDRRTRKLSQVVKAGQCFSAVISLKTHLERILSSAFDALSPEGIEVRLFEVGSSFLTTSASWGKPYQPSEVAVRRDVGIIGTALATQRPSIVPSPNDRDALGDSSSRYLSEIAVPLIFQGEVLGVLHLHHSLENAFDETDLLYAAVFADLIAHTVGSSKLEEKLAAAGVTLDNNLREMSRLNGELGDYSKRIFTINENLESRLKNLTAIHEAGKAFTSSLDLDATLSTILEMTSQIIGSTAAAIKLLDDETKEFCTRAQSGSTADIADSCTILEVPLQIGNKKIGIFELVCKTEDGLAADERRMIETIASQAAVAIENARLFKNTQQICYDTLKSLAQALEARDDYTRGHSERVARIARLIAEEMNLSDEDIETIENAALLHDIGKIGIRDDVLLAPRKLTDKEFSAIKEHSVFGNTILMPLKFLGKIRECVRHHHERWDGTGYPDSLAAGDIPTASRIIAVADTYDAMTSNRPYRKSISSALAVREITSQSGLQFDPKVVDAFMRVLAAHGQNGLGSL